MIDEVSETVHERRCISMAEPDTQACGGLPEMAPVQGEHACPLRRKKMVRTSGRLIAVNKRGRREEAGADLPEVAGVVTPALAEVAATALQGADEATALPQSGCSQPAHK